MARQWHIFKLPKRDQLEDRGARRRQNAGVRSVPPGGVMQKARPQNFSSSTCGKVPLCQPACLPAHRRVLLRREGEKLSEVFQLSYAC